MEKRFTHITDKELVALLESTGRFAVPGSVEREVLVRLAFHCKHPLAESDMRPTELRGGNHVR